MPIMVIGGLSFTPEEARDAIAIRDWLAGGTANENGFACPSLDGMSGEDALHWLTTAVVNAKSQREKHLKPRTTEEAK
jgi:hypothetical protein